MLMCFTIYNQNEFLEKCTTLHYYENDIPCKKYTVSKHFKCFKCVRYLGLIFDRNLRWNVHVNNVVMKLRSLTTSFHNLRRVISTHTLRIVYLSIYQAMYQQGLLSMKRRLNDDV